MKILRIVYDWPPPWDGLAPHPYELSMAQVTAGHTVEVFCGRWPKAGPIVESENISTHPFWREPIPGTVTLTTSIIMFFYYLYWRTENTPDVIHAQGHFAIWIYLYRLILQKVYKHAKELKTPLVVHFHNTVQGRWDAAEEKGTDLKTYTRFLAWPMEKLANKLAVKTADALIFVSEENKNEAMQHYSAAIEKCFVVENGVNAKTFRTVGIEEKDKTRKDLGLDSLDKVILNNGAMIERKNVHLLVEALVSLPEQFKLLLVGPGDKDYLYQLDKTISERGLGKRVLRVGYTPYPQIPIAFQASDIFVLPSSYEGLPKVVMQSLACGIPTLVSGFKLAAHIDGLYYLDELTPQLIAKRIQEILRDAKPVDAAKIAREYSWGVKAREVEEIYKIVISKHAN